MKSIQNIKMGTVCSQTNNTIIPSAIPPVTPVTIPAQNEPKKETRLIDAILDGNDNVIQELIASGILNNYTEVTIAMGKSIIEGKENIIDMLLDKGVSPKEPIGVPTIWKKYLKDYDWGAFPPIIHALVYGKTNIAHKLYFNECFKLTGGLILRAWVDLYISGRAVPFTAFAPECCIRFTWSSAYRNKAINIDRGIHFFEGTILHYAILNFKPVKVIKAILDTGISPNEVVKGKWWDQVIEEYTVSAIDLVLILNRFNNIDIMLDAGAKINNIIKWVPVWQYIESFAFRRRKYPIISLIL
jgi:hypothetical protein